MQISKKMFQIKIEEIVTAIRETGLDPYAQLSGYLRTGNDMFITCHNDARGKIKLLDTDMIQQYIESKMK